MSSKTRLYVVTDKSGGPTRLVRAASPAGAIRHVAEAMFAATPARPDDVEELLLAGVKPETAAAEPEPAPTPSAAAIAPQPEPMPEPMPMPGEPALRVA